MGVYGPGVFTEKSHENGKGEIMSEIVFNLILATALIALVFGCLSLVCAWSVGGEFYITASKGRRKRFFERLFDGLEKMGEF